MRHSIALIGILVLSVLISFIPYNLNGGDSLSRQHVQSTPQTQAHDDELADKVYNFREGPYTVNLTHLQFEKGLTYKIRFGAVTDGHQCHMELYVIDPEGDVYEIYTTNTSDGARLSFNDYREIPFGAALSGLYTINFTKLDGPTMNIHLQVLKDEQCVQKITYPTGVIRTEIEKFSKDPDGNIDIIYQYLEEQRMYEIFIVRISPVRGDKPINISTDFSIRDYTYNLILFSISLPSHLDVVYSPYSYSFGTSTPGEYRFWFEYKQPMAHTNLMVVIVDKYLIASGTEPNSPDNSSDSDSTPDNSTDTPSGIYCSVPIEAQLGVGLGVGLIVLLGALLVAYGKWKHAI